jgi:hypothetical protein
VLYVPPGWFHSTEALGTAPNLGLSYWTESDVQSRLYALRSAFRQRCGGGGKGGGSEGGAAGSAQAKRELLAALGRVIVRALDLDLRRDPAGACAMVVVVMMMVMVMMMMMTTMTTMMMMTMMIIYAMGGRVSGVNPWVWWHVIAGDAMHTCACVYVVARAGSDGAGWRACAGAGGGGSVRCDHCSIPPWVVRADPVPNATGGRGSRGRSRLGCGLAGCRQEL